MRLTEQEKKDILKKYEDNTSEELLIHLKRHFPVYEEKTPWGATIKFIQVDDKVRPLASNKKYLVNKISSLLEDTWIGLGIPTIRRTVKKYIDGITLF